MKKDEQTNVLLSLKNLYRLFTVKDYPVYSTGILGEKSKKGLTLVRFWDEYLLYEWKGTRHGKMIFRKDGSQNRYHSEFCNRKESFPLYQKTPICARRYRCVCTTAIHPVSLPYT